MAFYNDRGYIINDSLSNVHVVLENNNLIKLYSFDVKKNKPSETILVEEKIYEFDTNVDDNDVIYLVYQTLDGTLCLITINNGDINKSILIEGPSQRVYNLNVFIVNGNINIMYCVPSGKIQNEYRIIHHYYNGEDWETLKVGIFNVIEIINEFTIIKCKNNIILAYYSVEDDYEQIFIKTFNLVDKKWQEPIQLTNSQNNKIYLDIFVEPSDFLHLVYSEYDGGNLYIKYCKFEFYDNKITLKSESYLSDPCNCSYPTIILDEEKLWVVWTEYNHLLSLYTLDYGDTWSNPYYWRESERCNFLRYKFLSNDSKVNEHYRFNFAFGKVYPEISFIGFGNLEKAEEIITKNRNDYRHDFNNCEKNIVTSLKENENYNDDIIQIKRSIREINDQINKLRDSAKSKGDEEMVNEKIEEIEKMAAKLNMLETRIRNIEEFLDRRTRGMFHRSR